MIANRDVDVLDVGAQQSRHQLAGKEQRAIVHCDFTKIYPLSQR